MKISERIEGTIENWQAKWKDRLRGWSLRVIAEGINKLLEGLEEEARPSAEDFLARFPIHPEVKKELDAFLTKRSPVHIPAFAMMAIGIVIGSLIGTFMGWARPIANWTGYQGEKLIKSYRIDPYSVISAWRRDPATYEKLFDDLKDQGWSDDRIEALKFYTLFYPTPADLVRWQAREVFEPAMIEKYGLDDEYEAIEREPFYKAGMSDEQIQNYWRAHWEHASWMQVVEMLRRGQLEEKDVWDWFRLVEIPPFWRDKLIAISYEVPTRVDVRRFWDMRTIDEARLREIYAWQGYHGKDLDDYVRWTKVYNDFPMMITRWKNGWITEDDIRNWLKGLEIPEDRIQQFIEEKTKPEAPARVAAERDLTKTDIYRGVREEIITRGEGIELLLDMGYDENEAEFILLLNAPEEETVTEVKKRELTKTDILNGLKTEVITEAEARAKLLEIRYIPADAEFLLKIFKAAAKPPVEERERQVSKADVTKAVKDGLITSEEGYILLQDIGFSADAADFILAVRAEVPVGSPINYPELKSLTQRYRRAAGMPAKDVPEELKQAANELVRLNNDVKALEQAIAEEEAKLIEGVVGTAEEPGELKKLRVTLHRAQAELSAAQTRYNILVAEFRHKEV